MGSPLSIYSQLFTAIAARAKSTQVDGLYQRVVQPYASDLLWLVGLTVADLALLAVPRSPWLALLEVPFSFMVAVGVAATSFRLSATIFDTYLLETAAQDERKVNSELLNLGKFLAEALAVLFIVFCYAQAHSINLIGLAASLGIGGFAIAFASQKVIEQILWSVVLFIDRPFTIDDYIRLPDRTIGRVESM
ncbi:MAG: hypothetical protein AAF289_22800, partial [Cyanobacteria bacterium P01_A01_bin.135]